MVKRPFYTHPDPDAAGLQQLVRPALPRHRSWSPAASACTATPTTSPRWRRAACAPSPFEGYLEAFRYGMPPHGGFAIGLERLLMQLTGAPNLRLTTLFPRDLNRLAP